MVFIFGLCLVVLLATIPLQCECEHIKHEDGDRRIRSAKYPVPAEVRLIRDLMERYPSVRPIARPVINSADQVVISFKAKLIQILDFDVKNQVIKLMLWKHFIWVDELLTWEPADYDGLSYITLPPGDVWRPDIILHSHVGKRDVEHHNHVNLGLSHNGSIIWIPPIVYTSSCNVDMTHFPYDEQECKLKFGSWGYHARQLDIVLSGSPEMAMDLYTASTQWEILENTAERIEAAYPCCPEIFPEIIYTLRLKRHAGFHVKMLLLPALLLSCLVLVIFWIPAQRPDRTGLGMSLFSSFVLLLLVILGSSPPTPSAQLGTYCCSTIILVAIATIMSAFIVNIAAKKEPMSSLTRKIFVQYLAPVFGACAVCQATKATTSSDGRNPRQVNDEGLAEHQRLRQTQSDWNTVACVLDRICFIVYLIVIILCIIFVFPWPKA